jgi:protein SCO1/2
MGVRSALMVLFSAFVLAGCNCAPSATTQSSSISSQTKTNSGPQTFHVRGVIQEFRPADKEIVIKHEEIPDYMPAMTMPFPVKSTNEFAGLRKNDQVSFTMIVTEKDGWIQDLKKIGVDTNSLGSPQERPKIRLVRDVEPLKGGDKMPNYTFTNSLGKKVSLSDFAGQAYAFTFMFTRCPFPTFCPRMSSNYSEAFKLLSAETNKAANWHLLTISFDPEFDTPERLKEYSEYYHPDPKKWDFVTGAMIDIDAITEQAGLVFAYEKGTFNHNLRTVVIDKDGKIRMIFKGNEWKPEQLAAEMIAGARGESIPQERIGQTDF